MREEKIGNGHSVKLEQFLEDIKVVVRDGQELLKAGMGTVREQARAKAETTGRFVKDKPYQSLGVAFGVGILAGLLAAGLLHGGDEDESEEE